MVAAAFRESWRTPILLFGLIEKAYIVFLVGANLDQTFSRGFMAPVIMDGILAIFLVLYFVSRDRSA